MIYDSWECTQHFARDAGDGQQVSGTDAVAEVRKSVDTTILGRNSIALLKSQQTFQQSF